MAEYDEIGPWSEEKLNMLGDYLKQYCIILSKQKTPEKGCWLKEYCYIDAFAGSVTPFSKEEAKFIEGSPLRALNTTPPFDRYIFIDKDVHRVSENLAHLRTVFPSKNIEIICGDCNNILQSRVIPNYSKKSPNRAFVFLDPYGVNVRWEIIQQLGEAAAFDVLINFSVMGLTRMLPKTGKPNPKNEESICQLFGCKDWHPRVYRPNMQLTLFGGTAPPVRKEAIVDDLTEFYRQRLKSVFKYVTTPRYMFNSKNTPIYALIGASQNQAAVKIMNHIFSKKYKQQR